MFILQAGGVDLPAPVSMSVSDEIIWSSDTGRALDGTMLGDVVAEKKTISLKWAWLPEDQVATLKAALTVGFFPVTFRDAGVVQTIESYRGTLSKEVGGNLGDGEFWYKSVSVDIVQR